MPKKSVVFAGFTLGEYVEVARQLFPSTHYNIVCVYGREPSDKKREELLPLFDYSYDIRSLPADFYDSVELITCTQERDMETYIELLFRSGRIDEETAALWKRAINKKLFKETLQREHPELVPKVTPFSDAPSFIEALSYPIVIKPTNLTGSAFVSVVRNRQEFDEYLERVGNYDEVVKNLGRSPELVIEEFVSGPQYSMNVYVDKAGRISFCPIIRVVPAFEAGVDDTYSALQYNATLAEDTLKLLYGAISTIIETFKIKNTSAHFDCILSPKGWKICEVGLRIGGKRRTFFKTSHGFDHFQNDLHNRLGQAVDLGKRQSTVAIVQKASTTHGDLKEVRYPSMQDPNLNFYIDKLVDVGSRIGPVKTGGITAFRAFLSGKDESTVINSAEELFKNVVVKTDKD